MVVLTLLLLLLPGLAIVRAPWVAVPFLSASFWMLSWWWLPATSGRQRFVVGALAAFALLASLRLLNPLGARRPSWPAALVAGAALLWLVPFAFQSVAPDAGMSFHSTAALLMVWRDGLPSSYEPLLPIHHFGAYAPGLPALAADLTLLSGLPAHRSAFLVSAVAGALLHVALFGLIARLAEARAAAVGAVAGLGLAPVLWGGPPALALAFGLSSVALLVRGTGRAPAVAAGVFLGAALAADAATAAVVAALGLLAVAPRAGIDRLVVASIAALAVSVPLALRSGVAMADASERLRDAATLAAVAAAVTWLAVRLLPRKAGRVGLALLLAAAAGRPLYHAWVRPSPVTPDDLTAMAWLREHAGPLEVVCQGPRPAGLWIPALAGREIDAPDLPAVYAEEFRRRAGERPCAFAYGGPRADETAVYRNATVAIVARGDKP